MRRLTLILSDLYLPSEIGPAEFGDRLPAARELPALEWLLRFADSPQLVGDWRAWLVDQTCAGLKDLPVATVCADGRIEGREPEATWLATPVALEARLDHVRLVDRGLLRLDPTERASCREEFARIFGPQYLLHEGGERAFFLSGLPQAGVHVPDPARLVGSEIGPALPTRGAGELRRLWAEIEMWLHGAAFNAVRERAGKRRVSALWLWGAASSTAGRGQYASGRPDAEFYGGDPLIAALGSQVAGRERDVPKEWAQISSAAPHVVIELAALSGGSHESLEALDANWFAPARAALLAGLLPELELLANDRRFRIGARSHWRIWRGRRPWLAHLGASAKA